MNLSITLEGEKTLQQPTVIHSTFVLERSLAVTPERVFAAFADPIKKRRWFIEGGHHDIERFDMDFRIGGSERASYRFKEGTPLAGKILTSESIYQDIVPDRRMVFASSMSLADNRISATLVTVEILASQTGADLILTHQGAFFEGSDGPRRREDGWCKLLDRLMLEFPR
jgi:uncharacterized protein YndB with AHSA1/START domain